MACSKQLYNEALIIKFYMKWNQVAIFHPCQPRSIRMCKQNKDVFAFFFPYESRVQSKIVKLNSNTIIIKFNQLI